MKKMEHHEASRSKESDGQVLRVPLQQKLSWNDHVGHGNLNGMPKVKEKMRGA